MEATQNQTNPSVKIQVSLLDSLMNLAGELVLGRNQLLQAISCDDRRLLETTSQRIDLVASEIQEQIMRTRMQPMAALFDKLPRMVRDLALESGKQVDLYLTGKAVDIDKTIMEAIEAPLTRLIRIAVNHGIEAPDVREIKNKPPKGRIELKACHEAGQIVIEVIDDGQGIDPETLVHRAIEKGLISEQRGLDAATETEKMDLIFLPGLFEDKEKNEGFNQFACMEEIKSGLEKVGGVIDVSVKAGRGKQVRIKLPLTLSIIPSQIIRLGDERFAIPQVNLGELLRIPAGKAKHMIETVGGANVIRLRGELLPVIDLAESLGIQRSFGHSTDERRRPERRRSVADRRSKGHTVPEADYEGPERRRDIDRRCHTDSALNIAVVSTGKVKYGLVVDAMNDSEEIVVKPLGKHLKSCHGFAGAAIMGDGKVALILDVANISEMAALRLQSSQNHADFATDTKTAREAESVRSQSYLFFSNSETERLAVPLETVARVEKVDAATIETVGDKRVFKYRGGSLPLIALESAIKVDPLPEKKHYQVICFNVNGREVGLLATPPIDAAEVSIDLDRKTLKQSGVNGSAVLMDQTTLILDIQQVVKNAIPDFFNEA